MAPGPSLIFISLPKVFDAMGVFGRPVAIAFFLMMGFAALDFLRVRHGDTGCNRDGTLSQKPRKKCVVLSESILLLQQKNMIRFPWL